jgi:hypothetical protein
MAAHAAHAAHPAHPAHAAHAAHAYAVVDDWSADWESHGSVVRGACADRKTAVARAEALAALLHADRSLTDHEVRVVRLRLDAPLDGRSEGETVHSVRVAGREDEEEEEG